MSSEKDIYQRFDDIDKELVTLHTSLMEMKLDLEAINKRLISQSKVSTSQSNVFTNTNSWSSNTIWFLLGVVSFIFGYHLFDILDLFRSFLN
ncbi:hypothetical protein [Pleurocapsa sp. PCC 7319]|uniref:hypothetical protein n=1 Tax=Pleurocapsa sp. PCC 7319 TaxID=118161 RepID=UPI0003451BE0|nr:hypothetical protein [Pleurocapsa sp. PCC 7319]